MGACFLFDFPLKGEALNKVGKKNSQQLSVRKCIISARAEKLEGKKSSTLKFGLWKVEKGRVYFIGSWVHFWNESPVCSHLPHSGSHHEAVSERENWIPFRLNSTGRCAPEAQLMHSKQLRMFKPWEQTKASVKQNPRKRVEYRCQVLNTNSFSLQTGSPAARLAHVDTAKASRSSFPEQAVLILHWLFCLICF